MKKVFPYLSPILVQLKLLYRAVGVTTTPVLSIWQKVSIKKQKILVMNLPFDECKSNETGRFVKSSVSQEDQ